MDVSLHLGVHRTASTCFQFYLRENAISLRDRGVECWGPWRTRDGVLTGVIPVSGSMYTSKEQLLRARGRINLSLHRAKRRGRQHVVVSDENMIGAPRRNLRANRLYPGIGERMARFNEAFAGRISRIVLSIRAQDDYWSSSLAFAVGRGHPVPTSDDLDRLVTTNRSWRDVIRDLACAVPGVDIHVMPYEQYGGRPEQKLVQLTGLDTPPMHAAREWINRSPSIHQLRQILRDRGQDPELLPDTDGRWQPFNDLQSMALKEAYADDMFWLRAGAEGLAQLTEETGTGQTGQIPHQFKTQRGQLKDGIENRRMA